MSDEAGSYLGHDNVLSAETIIWVGIMVVDGRNWNGGMLAEVAHGGDFRLSFEVGQESPSNSGYDFLAIEESNEIALCKCGDVSIPQVSEGSQRSIPCGKCLMNMNIRISGGGERTSGMTRTGTEEMNTRNLRPHSLLHDILQELPIDLEWLGIVDRGVSFRLAPAVFMFDIPVPLKVRFCVSGKLHGWKRRRSVNANGVSIIERRQPEHE